MIVRRLLQYVLPAWLLLAQSACGCDASIEFSVAVQVVDARTGVWAAEGAAGTLQIGSVKDSLRVVGFSGSPPNDTATTLGNGMSQAGPFRLTIEKAGYFDWEHQGVVREGSCGVRTVHVTARLRPITS